MKVKLEIVLEQSKDCFDSGVKLRGLMKDLYPEEIKEINILLLNYSPHSGEGG